MRLDKTREYLLLKLQCGFNNKSHYHSIEHILEVERSSKEILDSLKDIREADKELVLIASLFHDVGHMVSVQSHEEESCKSVSDILPDFGYNNKEIEKVNKLIMATKFPHNPVDVFDEIICDADLSYLGKDGYEERAEKLRFELIGSGNVLLEDEKEWIKFQLDFLQEHHFFTDYAISNYQPAKVKIIEMLKQKSGILS